MIKRIHKVSNVDTENKTGHCSNCGIVDVYLKSKSWVCLPGKRIGVNASRQRQKYGNLIETRPNVCSVCEKKCVTRYDHDHATGKFRGWLCNGCNLALGNAYDSPEILRKLADYLERAQNASINSNTGNA